MIIITAGAPYIDIDAFAGIVAEAELQRVLGNNAQAVTTAPMNETIPATVLSWKPDYKTHYTASSSDTFTVIDLSDPNYFDTFVDPDKVETVIDHHTGFEQFWNEKIGKNATIEFIGAASTLVYERWKNAQVLDRMSQTSARLLLSAILDNTLFFKAKVSTARDKQAYEALLRIADLDSMWPEQYFLECQETIESHISESIRKNTKRFDDGVMPAILAQLCVWNTDSLLIRKNDELADVFKAESEDWAINLLDISKSRSIFVAQNTISQKKLTHLLNIKFENGIAKAERMWLRKEIIKMSQYKFNT